MDNSKIAKWLKQRIFLFLKVYMEGYLGMSLHILPSVAEYVFGLGLSNAVHAKVDSKLSKIVSPEIR